MIIWFHEYVLYFHFEFFIFLIPVPNKLNVSNMFKPDMCNEPFIFVVLFNVVNPDTFNDDNNVVLL